MTTLTLLNTKIYTIERVKEIYPYGDIAAFFYEVGPALGDLYGFEFSDFDFFHYAQQNILWLCRRRGKPVGVMLARLYPSVWDQKSKVLWQDSLYCKKSSGKAAYLLLKQFIDFGRAEANLVFTCKAKHTNVKEKSFERLGFKKTEELFLLGE